MFEEGSIDLDSPEIQLLLGGWCRNAYAFHALYVVNTNGFPLEMTQSTVDRKMPFLLLIHPRVVSPYPAQPPPFRSHRKTGEQVVSK